MSTSADSYVVWLAATGPVYWLAGCLFAVSFAGVVFGWLGRAAKAAASAR